MQLLVKSVLSIHFVKMIFSSAGPIQRLSAVVLFQINHSACLHICRDTVLDFITGLDVYTRSCCIARVFKPVTRHSSQES